MLTAEMGSGQPQHLAQAIGEVEARAAPNSSDWAMAQRALPVLVIKQEDAGEGEIAVTPGIFSERPAPAARPFRQTQLGDNLVRPAERRERPGEKIAGAYRARSG